MAEYAIYQFSQKCIDMAHVYIYVTLYYYIYTYMRDKLKFN